MPIKKRHAIRDSDIRKIVGKLKPKLGKEIENILSGKVETAEMEEGESIILVDEEPVLLKKENKIYPFITAAEMLSIKRVTVDMGAVKPISDGADIMAPGIVEVDENIESGDIVGTEDEKNRKIIAVGISLKESSHLMGNSGKVIKNIHHVGDSFWDFTEDF